MITIWDAILHMLETAPMWLTALCAGVAGAVVSTQSLKPWISRLNEDARRASLQGVSLVAGVVWTWAAWPCIESITVGVIAGLGAPLFWAIFVWAMRKRWPDFGKW